jgi:hypothetical protein
MTNRFFTKTKIPLPNIDYRNMWNNDPDDPSDTLPRWKTYPNKPGLWDEHTTRLLESIGLTPILVRIFRWAPNKSFPWHIDGSIDEITQFAINWVVEGDGIIEWTSKLILPPPSEKFSHLAFGTLPSVSGDSYLTECANKGDGCLINTTIPHRVVNNNNIHRITISIQFGNKLTYEQAAAKLILAGLSL